MKKENKIKFYNFMFSFSNKYKEYYNFVIFAKNKSYLKKG